MIKVGVLGAQGRMGSLVCQTVRSADDLELVAAVDVDDSRDALKGCDVVVDFTSPAAVLENLRWCVQSGLSMVIGTSGFTGPRLAEAGRIGSDERVVAYITGEGLKTLDAVRESFVMHEIEPTLDAFEAEFAGVSASA